MSVIKGIFFGIWKIYLALIFLLTLLVFIPFFWFYTKSEKNFEKAYTLARLASKVMQTLGFIRFEVYGKENIPQNGGFIICSNHSSYLDILLTFTAFENYICFIGKQEIANYPIINLFFKTGMNILVNRGKARDAESSLNAAKVKLANGVPVLIFPEGTIPADAPKLKPFKSGAFRLACETNTPILPMAFKRNHRLLQVGGWFKSTAKPGITKLYIDKLIYPENVLPDKGEKYLSLQKEVRAVIQGLLNT